ncbi:hypothetical protein KFU94_29880 [Chloroflexi bacterium TSY]|nr:hypothetical protein [Chloroflexi bacterium TSY]
MKQDANGTNHAIVVGSSMAGLLTARVLSDHFGQVTIVERDRVSDRPESRRGQPQTGHTHLLLAKGLEIMLDLFPDLLAALESGGAIVRDMAASLRWHVAGDYRLQCESGIML